MNNNYYKAYVEVLEILKYIPSEERNKVPDEIIEILTKNADKNYKFNLDFNIPFENQILLNETKAVLAIFYKEYWANDSERERMSSKEQNELNKEFKYDDLFYRRNKEEKSIEKSENLVLYEREKWYIKFIGFFKKIFNKNN